MTSQSRSKINRASSAPSANLFDLGSNQGPALPSDLSSVTQLLEGQGLNQEIARTLQRSIADYVDTQLTLDRLIAEALEPMLSFDPRLPLHRKAVALVGEPGSGKTITIAKLAARMQNHASMKVGLIALDAFRDSSSRQLQTYASLLNIPFRALDPNRSAQQELSRALKVFQDYDLILIDTFGCASSDARKLTYLRNTIGEFEEIEPILVLPAPASEAELAKSARAFERLAYERVIICGLDQSGFIGPALNTAVQFGKSIAFLGTGPRVAEDIEPAGSRRLGCMLSRSLH